MSKQRTLERFSVLAVLSDREKDLKFHWVFRGSVIMFGVRRSDTRFVPTMMDENFTHFSHSMALNVSVQ